MKKLICLLSGLFLLGFAVSAQAVPIWFDADGTGNNPVLMTELSAEMFGGSVLYQSLGSDGVLNTGDSFSESFLLDIIRPVFNSISLPAYTTEIFINTNPPPVGNVERSYLYSTVTNVVGYIDSYTSGLSTPTDVNNPGNIFDDEYSTLFTGGVADFYWDSDGAVTGPTSATKIGSFAVIGGGSDEISGENDTLTGDIGMTLKATFLAPGHFFKFTGDFVTPGPDISTLDEVLLLALADASVNITGLGVLGDNTSELDDDALILLADDNGTDIEFEPVPEPATMFLLGSGLLGLAGLGRRRFRKKD